MSRIVVLDLDTLPFDDFSREYILPNGVRISEETYRRRLRSDWPYDSRNYYKSHMFIDNLPTKKIKGG